LPSTSDAGRSPTFSTRLARLLRVRRRGFNEFSEFLGNSASRCATRSTKALFKCLQLGVPGRQLSQLGLQFRDPIGHPHSTRLTHIARSVVDPPAQREEDLTG
jgi:hypothetical protein